MLAAIRKLLDAKAATSHAHAAADLTSGTIATARLGSGTANSSSFLRGDQTWAAIAAGAKAWVRITGSTGAIVASSNVASVTRHSAGYYTVTFAGGLMANANFVGFAMPSYGSSAGFSPGVIEDSAGRTTTTFKFWTISSGGGPGPIDFVEVGLVFFGD